MRQDGANGILLAVYLCCCHKITFLFIMLLCNIRDLLQPMQFIGLLSGSCCKYMPLLILDRFSVLSDLPVTLSSLLNDPSWTVIAEHFTATLLASTERIYHWVTQPSCGEGTLTLQGIDKSENSLAPSLLQVMHDACTLLRNYLPLEKQIALANMAIHRYVDYV